METKNINFSPGEDPFHPIPPVAIEDEYSNNCIEVDEASKSGKKTLKRKRELRSKVWDHFERVFINDSAGEKVTKMKCKYCAILINCDNKYINEICVKRDTGDIGQMLIGNEHGSMLMRSSKFTDEKFCELLICAALMHNLPLSFVEYSGIKGVLSYLKDDVPSISRNSAKIDMVKLHRREKNKIKSILNETPGRVSLTSDMWISATTDVYLCLTAHFIDKNWVLQKRILNFSYMPPPHNGIALSEKLYGFVADWGIESKLLSLTMDNAFANDCVDYLQLQLNERKALLGQGKYFNVRCCAHVLNLIVQEGLEKVDNVVQKARESVKYVKGSQVRKQKFLESVRLACLNPKRGLRQDVPTRWNSTFLMLQSALYFRSAFSHLEITDSNYKHCPSKNEWDMIEKLCKLLEVFYEITCVFSEPKHPTTNLYFPAIFKARLTLEEHMKGVDLYMKSMATRMYAKFENYWSTFSLILAISVIFDPRYKIDFVDWGYNKLYGRDSTEFKSVKESLFSLYNEYAHKVSPIGHTSSTYMNAANDHTSDSDDSLPTGIKDVFQEFDAIFGGSKSELEMYLNEQRVNRKTELDILQYWKEKQYSYPKLSAMARDILSIPISTVSSKSAFSVGGRVVDQYQSSLKPEILEGIVCCKDWLAGDLEPVEMELNVITEDMKYESTPVQDFTKLEVPLPQP